MTLYNSQISVAARSEAWVCDRCDCGFESGRGAWMSVVSVVCCQVEASSSG
jgi:hypothetical protein